MSDRKFTITGLPKHLADIKNHKEFLNGGFPHAQMHEILKMYGLVQDDTSYFTIENPFSKRFAVWQHFHLNEYEHSFCGNFKSFQCSEEFNNQDRAVGDTEPSGEVEALTGDVMALKATSGYMTLAPGVYSVQIIYRHLMSMDQHTDDVLVFVNKDFRWDEERMIRFFKDFCKTFVTWYDENATEKEDKKAFDGLFLPDKLLTDIRQEFDSFLSSRDLYQKELKLPWKRGYMLIGPPGNGKTRSLRCISKYYNIRYFDVKEIIQRDGSLNFGQHTEQHIDALLYPNTKPEMFVLEDIDKLTAFQGGDVDHKDSNEISLHDLLKSIDGVDQPNGVIIMATTNYPNMLAEALINRPGRFDRLWEFDKPAPAEILKMLVYHHIMIKDGNGDRHLDKIVSELHGYSMAFVEDFVKSVKMKYRRNEVTEEEVKDILERIHKHNDMYKEHFEQDKPSVGFSKHH